MEMVHDGVCVPTNQSQCIWDVLPTDAKEVDCEYRNALKGISTLSAPNYDIDRLPTST